MHPSLALVLTLVFIFYLFKRDLGQPSTVSHALWIPWLWMMILGSKFVSEWLNPGASAAGNSYEDGSPIDRIVFLFLLISASYVLWQRRPSWPLLFQNNIGLVLFLGYCAVSILWSEFPFVAFKRWTKILGHPLMALIILSEGDPVKAVETVIRRCAYVLIPMSVLYIKYYPHLGRGFDEWTGAAVNIGITNNKNALGFICLVFGLFFTCKLLSLFHKNMQDRQMMEKIITITFLYMTWWLLQISHSGTSLGCLIASVFVVLILGFSSIKKHFESYILIGVLIFCILQLTLNITDRIILSFGKDLTLTDRTEVWAAVLQIKTDPLIGTGFESFWLGKRLETLWAEYWWKPNQAHNGYIETYINLGWLGLFFLAGAIFSSFRNIRKALLGQYEAEKVKESSFDFGRFRMGFLVALIIYNLTEATFKALHFLFFIFFVITIEYPHIKSKIVASKTASRPRSSAQSSWGRLYRRSDKGQHVIGLLHADTDHACPPAAHGAEAARLASRE